MKFLRWSKKRELITIALAVFLVASGSAIIWISTFELPDLKSFTERKISQSTKIYDRTGKILLYDVHENVRRTVVGGADIGINIKNATVAIEDSEFYEHMGIRPLAFLRAVLANLSTGSYSQGGSTITQQVVKNTLLTSEKKISRKLKEWVLALKLERVMAKDEILTIYLNESPYGGNIYGIEEASQSYFGKKASELTLAEAAYLASLPNAPTYYSPYGNNRQKLEERKNLVLKKMLEKGFVSPKEYELAMTEKVEFLQDADQTIKAPHFVIYVKQYLENKFGKEAVEVRGLKVTTTLDYDLQEKAERVVEKYALPNKEQFNATNEAMVAINPKNGDVLTMVGSNDYFSTEIDGNFNVAVANRQPGSSFKPFVYAAAFNKGYLPETVVFDLETEFSSECKADGTPLKEGDEDKCYKPQNYDETYRGPISLRDALAQSINIPAIKVLYLAGMKNALQLAKDLGITSLGDTNQYGLTLVLGGGEVSLLDMTGAYGGFANNGEVNHPRVILKIEDVDGNVLESAEPNPKRVMPEQTALLINDVLSDNVARTPAYSASSPLFFPGREVAAKTGTTNDYRDAWIIGYTPGIVVGAWTGNNDNTPMAKKVAGFIVAPMWHEFMAQALASLPPEKFKKPEPADHSKLSPVLRGIWQGGQSYFVDKISGKLATEYTPPDLRQEKVVREVHSILYWIDKDNPTGTKVRKPEDDSQFLLWETPVLQWSAKHGYATETPAIIPTEKDPVHKPELAPKLILTSNTGGKEGKRDGKIVFTITSTGAFPLAKTEFYINDEFVGSTTKPPFNYSFVPDDLGISPGENLLKVVGFDNVQNRSEISLPFRVGY